jgi:hypothetical protein
MIGMTDIRSELSEGTEPAWMRSTVERLLASLPDGYCQGLGAIVLTRTDIASGRKGRRSRANRKVRGVSWVARRRPSDHLVTSSRVSARMRESVAREKN